MASLNKVFLIGRLGADPNFKTTSNWDIPVCHFSLATNESFKDREDTQWHNIVVWGKLAETCNEFLKKGSLVHLEGKLKNTSWEDKQTKQKHYKTEIEARNIQFLDNKL